MLDVHLIPNARGFSLPWHHYTYYQYYLGSPKIYLAIEEAVEESDHKTLGRLEDGVDVDEGDLGRLVLVWVGDKQDVRGP